MKDEKEQIKRDLDETHDLNRGPTTRGPGAHPFGVAGAVAGAAAGKGVAEAVNPITEDEYWRKNFSNRPYVNGHDYSHYQNAFKYGWESASKNHGKSFEEVEPSLEKNWLRDRRDKTGLEWLDVREAIRDAYNRVENSVRRTTDEGEVKV